MKASLGYALLPVFVFAGAFLMFVLEPLVGRLLLPAYGGGFHVWTTCLMFFQGVLLLGYLYAHFVAPRIGRWHVAVACLPLALLPIDVAPDPDPSAPIVSILLALAARIAIPIAVLSTSGVVAQTWLARSDRRDGDPYWLYAASNAGSLLGLLAYPLLIEPTMGLMSQRLWWSALYIGYLALVVAVAPRGDGLPAPAAPETDGGPRDEPVTGRTVACWLALSTGPSIMLMAVTNAISFDVGSIPLVWVAPLALYLSTFILVFGKTLRYPTVFRRYWPEMAIAGLVALAAAPLFPSWPRLGAHLLALFAVCLAGHAELHRRRPAARDLTKFYLTMSVGGWLGGLFVSLVAPSLFDRLFEYPIAVALLACGLFASRRQMAEPARPAMRLQNAVRTPVAVAALAFAAAWMLPAGGESRTRLALMRNHYGVYQVGELTRALPEGDATTDVAVRYIVHNGTVHGGQIMRPDLRRTPIGYYHPRTGLGDVMRLLARPVRLGVVGLGAGGTAALVDAGDEITFYEIDPDDETIARTYFSYLGDCPAATRVVLGDARMTLAADTLAPDGYYDAFLVDAFSGDAIPTHLLTVEALELYRRKVRPGGVLAFHVTNRFYDLRPMLEAAATRLGMHGAYKTRRAEDGLAPLERRTRYFVLSDDAGVIDRLVAKGWVRVGGGGSLPSVEAWTDDYINVLAAMWAQLRGGS